MIENAAAAASRLAGRLEATAVSCRGSRKSHHRFRGVPCESGIESESPVRILPDSPSVDYLRREAKDLLVAWHEQDPTVALSDAQRAVAEQYGFRTWPDLKAEVERRRTADRPTAPGAAEQLAAAFDLGAVCEPMTPIAYAFMGRRWRLTTERGDWLVGPVFDWIGAEQASTAAELRERARAVGVAAPEPVRAADGALVKRLGGQNWRVDRWIDAGSEVLQPVRSVVATEIGRTLALIHSAGTPTDRALVPGTHGHLTHRCPPASWDELLQRARSTGAPWVDEAVTVREKILRPLEEVPPAEPTEPFRICIQDLNAGAVRMGRSGEVVCMHWDFAGPNQRSWELAYVLRQWASDQRTNPGTARALADGYQEVAGGLPSIDRSSFWVAITASLNWVHDQLSRSLDSEGERRTFSEGALLSELADPFSLAKIDRILDEVTA